MDRGGTLAYRLAPTGDRILLLERGDYIPREPEEPSYTDAEHLYRVHGERGATQRIRRRARRLAFRR